MYKKVALVFLALSCVAFSQTREPKMQIALLLDTSGSMDGLIEQAKTRLWDLVNQMASARKGGADSVLEVALYEYGKSTIPAEQHFLKQLVGLTTDLDKVSEALFALRTNGGDEFCGRVIHAATAELAWSPHTDDYKAVFIAGNEPFSQGDMPYATACSAAIARGIVVNTIFCGDEAEGIRTGWKDGATLADGEFMVIDHNKQVKVAAAPQDAKIIALSKELNGTYLGYGKGGKQAETRQKTQDAAALAAAPSVAVQRAEAKTGKAYRTASWDLVDAVAEGKVDLHTIEAEALPEEMAEMDEAARKQYVAQKADERRALKEEIAGLQKARKDYLKTVQPETEGTLDAAVADVVRDQLKKRDFQLDVQPKKETANPPEGAPKP